MRLLDFCGVAAALLLAATPVLAQAPAPDRASAAAKTKAWALVDDANKLMTSDPAKARLLSEQAAALSDDPELLNNLSIYHANGIGGPADRAKARELQEKAVTAGSVAAKLNLGRALIYADSDADRQRGAQLLSEAAANEKLGPFAAGGLGVALVLGKGVKQDIKAGVDMLERADKAEANDGHVLYLLGRTYQNGWGGRAVDPARSFRYFKRACERDWSHGCWYAGMALLNGAGVGKDEREAYRWVRRGADQGDLASMISTAVMLATAEGVAEDDPAAREWYRMAAEEHSSAHALRALGMMLFIGEGGAADQARGYAYMKLAAEAGDRNAPTLVEKIGAVPPQVTAEAERIRAEWISAHGMPTPDR